MSNHHQSTFHQMAPEFYAHKKVLVTGGAGFIGSHLCHALVSLGARIIVVDDLSTGATENLEPIKEKISFVKGSITDVATCLQATEAVDVVFHLAALISVQQSVRNPLHCYEVNIQGTANLLQACQQNKVPKFIFSSSSAVYGTQTEICTEQTPCSPVSAYGFSKLMGEYYCNYYARTTDVHTLCLRYFNVYGERQNPAGDYAAVVAKFRHQLHQNAPLTLYGDGQQTRDFITVEKVVEANIMVAMLEQEKMNGQALNIASGKSINLLELIALLRQAYPQSTSQIRFQAPRAGDIRHSAADCSKYRELTTPHPLAKPQDIGRI